MRAATSLVTSSAALLVALTLWASPAMASCTAPPGTAATDQYCETVPTVVGPRDASVQPAAPLAVALPRRVAAVLRKEKGVLGDVILAMPATPATAGDAPTRAAARRAASDPRLDALRPGSGAGVLSVAQATANVGGYVEQGFAWTLVLTLVAIAGVSVWGSLRGWSVR